MTNPKSWETDATITKIHREAHEKVVKYLTEQIQAEIRFHPEVEKIIITEYREERPHCYHSYSKDGDTLFAFGLWKEPEFNLGFLRHLSSELFSELSEHGGGLLETHDVVFTQSGVENIPR